MGLDGGREELRKRDVINLVCTGGEGGRKEEEENVQQSKKNGNDGKYGNDVLGGAKRGRKES